MSDEGARQPSYVTRPATYLRSGFVPRTAIEDNIIREHELTSDPHEVWRWDWYWGGWIRVEIEG